MVKIHPSEAGIATSFEMAIRFSGWAQSMGERLTRKAIQEHWHVSRATAYRWLNAYRSAVGISA
jgi:transposase